MGLLSVIGNVAGSLIGNNKADKAQKRYNAAYQKNLTELKDLINSWTESGNSLLAEKGGILQQMMEMSEAGGKRSEAAIGQLGQAAYRRINERERQSLGALNQGLAQRGLYNTTVGANLERGVRSDSNRAFGEVDEGLAGLRSSLINQNTNRNMGALGALGGLQSEKLQFGSNQQQSLVNLLQGSTNGQLSSSTGYGQMGSDVGGLLGSLFGNPLTQAQQQQVAGAGANAASAVGWNLSNVLTGGALGGPS